MFKTLKIAALSIALGMGALAVQPAAAANGGLYLGFGGGHGPQVGIEFRSNRHHFDRRHHRAGPRMMRGCQPQRALNKAARMGVRHAHIRGVNRNVVRVGGFKRGHRVHYVFANSRHCPLIRR